ncbi:uncharacterized protein F4812DRAFT_323535 [Daldinia caldariorum]|uniref:uncharacterized protein n=1 Tax=Daldinia caldariorum TaxID=326644 RepID=UPI002007CBFC|nr:uncharacterized protein F4812DRAFT_323535 [Daldinia caldariorum]KAI1469248.1 hypothetical protein F4812DRAFT_323535 [Daldinia caldariorum]
MASLRTLSDAEIRLFNQVCGAVNATSESQKDLLKSFIYGELTPEWTCLMALAESDGPLSVLSEDELKYLNSLRSATRGHGSAKSRGEADIFSDISFSQKVVDHDMIKAALHDVHQYNNVLEKLLVKYKDYVHRSIANLQRPLESSDEASIVKQKILILSRRKDLLKSKIHSLENKINHHTDQLEGTNQTETSSSETDNNERLNSVAPKQVFGSTIASYDHILSRLNALHGELGNDAVDDDEILRIAKRHANQIVLSLATKCRASLDSVFLETASTSSKRVSFPPENAQAVKDERDDVYAEIQSLWEEMVPLAHMVVEKEYLKSILGKIETRSERQNIRDATVSRYTYAMLNFMNDRLSVLADRTKMLAYHHQSLLDTLTYINNATRPDPAKDLSRNPPSDQNKGSTKMKDRTLLDIIRRQMELYGSVPIEVDKTNALTTYMQIRKLDQYVTARQKKGHDLSRNIHEFFEKVAKAELTDAELGSQLLLDSIIADSAASSQRGGHVYEDQQVEDSVATLKSQAEEIKTVFRELRVDEPTSPMSAPDFVTYAHNQAAKQFSIKENGSIPLSGAQEQCPRFIDLVRNWGDSSNFSH